MLSAQELPEAPRRLICGRMAHPAEFRLMARNATVAPKPGLRPTSWQREVGQVIAEAYGVHAFDPETFVFIGPGQPIGYPDIKLGVEPPEWDIPTLWQPLSRLHGPNSGDAITSRGSQESLATRLLEVDEQTTYVPPSTYVRPGYYGYG